MQGQTWRWQQIDEGSDQGQTTAMDLEGTPVLIGQKIRRSTRLKRL